MAVKQTNTKNMKNSGIEWIGEIPRDWDVLKVKNLFYLSKVKANIKEPIVLSLARSGVKNRDISNNEGQLAESYEEYNPVVPGDLLLNPMDLYSGANCSMSEVSGVISPAYINLRSINNTANSKFYDYYFKTQYWSMAMFAHGKGVSYDNRWTINKETLLNYYIPYVDLRMQNEIVNVLNDKLAKIDLLIKTEEQQIDKLNEYKQSLITEIVTKGLDKNAPMKDSGVEWIGKIANNRKVVRLKYLLNSQLQYGANETGYVYSNEYCVRYVRITDIDAEGFLKNDDNNLYLNDKESKDFMLCNNDLLFARSGATVGKTFLYNDNYGKCAFAGYLIRAKCNDTKILPKFLYYYTNSSLYEMWKNSIFIQATIQNIGANKYSNLEVVVMPIEEQKIVVNYLDKENAKIDKIIKIKEEKISKLNEYKKSLIYEYVTGKKEV